MPFGTLCQHQQEQFGPVVHPRFQQVDAVCHYPVQPPDDSLSRDVYVDFYRQCSTVKIIHHINGPEASAADQRVVHIIDGPALV